MHLYFTFDFVQYRVDPQDGSVESKQTGEWVASTTAGNHQIAANAMRIRNSLIGVNLLVWTGDGDTPVEEGTPIVRALRNGEIAFSRAMDSASRVWRWGNSNSPDDIVGYHEVDDFNDEALRYSFPYGMRLR